MLCTMHVSVLLADGAGPRVKALLTEAGDSQSVAPEHYMASDVSECVPLLWIFALWLVEDIFFIASHA